MTVKKRRRRRKRKATQKKTGRESSHKFQQSISYSYCSRFFYRMSSCFVARMGQEEVDISTYVAELWIRRRVCFPDLELKILTSEARRSKESKDLFCFLPGRASEKKVDNWIKDSLKSALSVEKVPSSLLKSQQKSCLWISFHLSTQARTRKEKNFKMKRKTRNISSSICL